MGYDNNTDNQSVEEKINNTDNSPVGGVNSEDVNQANGEIYLDGQLLARMAQGGAAQLRSNAEEVNRLNVFPVPDGDTGDNMSMTIESGIAAIENSTTTNLADVIRKLSHGMLLGARGNSGVILSQFFAGVAKGLENYSKADAYAIGNALVMGVKQAYTSVITPTEGTILTVAREAVEYSVAKITPETTIKMLFSDLVKEMYASLQRTPEILTVLKEAGVIDSGGAGLFYIMDGFYRVLNGEEIAVADIAPQKTSSVNISSFGPDSVMTYGYCTELLLQLQTSKVDLDTFDYNVIVDFLKSVGDSIVAFRTESIVKIHVHTLTPEKVLAECRKYGEFLTVKIENMSVQHNESEDVKGAKDSPSQHKKYGMVAVCSGQGIADTFKELGVDYIIEGGQTQNPSTSDFISAFDIVNADHIYVFPNNGNVIMAAKQAADIYTKSVIHVIESKDIGSGYVAASSMNYEEEDPESLAKALSSVLGSVATGCISPSIRDAELNGIKICSGDYIGFVGKEMLVSEKGKSTSAEKLVSIMIEENDAFMLTVFFGKDTDEKEKGAFMSYMEDSYPDIEVYYRNGDQEIYPYIFIVE